MSASVQPFTIASADPPAAEIRAEGGTAGVLPGDITDPAARQALFARIGDWSLEGLLPGEYRELAVNMPSTPARRKIRGKR